MSSPKSPDQILKRLHFHLSGKAQPYRLKRLGWFDFQNHDHPNTTDPVEMAYAAFVALSLEESGNWNGATDVLTPVLSYLAEATGYSCSEAQLINLAALLREQPVRSAAVKAWFEQIFL